MKRSDRVRAVVRVREIQEDLAETEALRRRREADQRRAAAEDALDDLNTRSAEGIGAALSFTELARRRTVLDGAIAATELSQQRLDDADERFGEARDDWHDAHRRHDAVDRLLERTVTGEQDEDARRAQRLIDDVVASRHARNHDPEDPA